MKCQPIVRRLTGIRRDHFVHLAQLWERIIGLQAQSCAGGFKVGLRPGEKIHNSLQRCSRLGILVHNF